MAKSSVFSLDTYEKNAEKNFKSYKIRVDEDTIVTLYNPIRISDENRAQVFELASKLDVDGDLTNEQVSMMGPIALEIMRLVGDENVDILISRIRNDLAVTMNVFQDYFTEIDLGEASSSES